MKTKHFLPFIAMAIGMGSCTNDLVDETNPLMGKRDVIVVSVDNADTRTAMNGNNVVWSTSDAIGIFAGSMNNEYSLSSGAGTTSAEFTGLASQSLKEAAYFPFVEGATWANDVISTTLPTAYTYSAESNNNAVMAALMAEDAQSSISFQNAGALYAITVENIPDGYDKAVMTYLGADDKVGIAGAATITFVDGVPTLAVPEAADAASAKKTITITFTSTGSKTFYFPMPVIDVETFPGLQFSLQGEDETTINVPAYTKKPQRNKLYAETWTLDNVSGGIVSEATDIDAANAALANDAVTSVAVKDATDTKAITIPAKSAESAAVKHTIDLSGATLPDGAVSIVVEEATGEGATVEELTVIVPEGANAGSYTINAPSTTVTIQGADGTVIETIEATTAEHTLIIGEGVKVNSLIINKGNVELGDGASVVSFKVKNEAGLRTAVALGGKVTLLDDITLTGYRDCIWVKNECEIDLGEYDITHAESTVLKIAEGGKLTIGGNGIVETKDNLCGAIANWGGTLIINGGTYKSIGAAAIYCDRGTENGTSWNLTIEGGEFVVTGNATAVSLQNNGPQEDVPGLATINGGIFTGKNTAPWHDLYLCNVTLDIKAYQCTFSQGKGVWLQTKAESADGSGVKVFKSTINGNEVSMENTSGMYLFPANVSTEEELRTAVAAGGKVTLQNDIELTGYRDCIWVKNECEIDLGEYDITHAESTVLKIAEGGKLTIGGNGIVETKDNLCGAIANWGGTLIINGGTYKSIGAAAIYCDRGTENGTSWNLTIEGGEFVVTGNATAVSLQNNGPKEDVPGLATINGGTFTGKNTAPWHDLYLCNVTLDIKANQCTFSQGKGVWLQTKAESADGSGVKDFSSVINSTTYTEASVGVANGYILND